VRPRPRPRRCGRRHPGYRIRRRGCTIRCDWGCSRNLDWNFLTNRDWGFRKSAEIFPPQSACECRARTARSCEAPRRKRDFPNARERSSAHCEGPRCRERIGSSRSGPAPPAKKRNAARLEVRILSSYSTAKDCPFAAPAGSAVRSWAPRGSRACSSAARISMRMAPSAKWVRRRTSSSRTMTPARCDWWMEQPAALPPAVTSAEALGCRRRAPG
jgi:hypothetical protein